MKKPVHMKQVRKPGSKSVIVMMSAVIVSAFYPLMAQETRPVQSVRQAVVTSTSSQAQESGGALRIQSAAVQSEQFPALQANFTRCEVFRFNGQAIQDYVHAKGDVSDIDLNLGSDYRWKLHMQLTDFRSSHYVLREQTANGVIVHPRSRAITYWGYVNDNPGDIIRMNVHDGQLSGLVRVNGKEFFLEPVNRFDKSASADLFVVYRGEDLKADADIKCGMTQAEDALQRLGGVTDATDMAPACAEVAIAADYSMVTEQGSVTDVETEVTGILNLVTAKYQESPMEISYDLVEIYVSSCSGCDPWPSGTGSSALLSSFASWGPTGFSKTYDIGSLWTNRDLDNSGVIGLAYVGTVCTSNRHNIMEHYFVSQGGNMVDQTHEMGHNWNCNHYGSGDATHIMSPTIGPGNTTWSTQSQNSIVNHKNSRTCLTASCLSQPVANFTANTTILSAGGSVNFTDLSSGNPNAWSWNFGGGGTPNTSSVKDPSGIAFNTPGLYTVSLTSTNANGSDGETKTDYIKVNANKGCDTLNLGFYQGKDTPAWTITQYYTGATLGENGWVNGVNINEELAKAQYFPAAAPNTHIQGGWMHVGKAYSSDPNKIVKMTVWDGTGATPGAVLGSADITMQRIMSDEQGNFFTSVIFDPPIAVPASGEFFMGVDLSNLNWATDKDTLSIVCNTNGQSVPSMVWEKKAGGNWLRYNTTGSWALDISLTIFPFMADGPPTIVTTSSSVCGSNCDGTVTANVSGGTSPYTYTWSPGGATTAIVTGLCAGTYTVSVRQQTGCFGGRTTATISSVTNTVTSTASKTDANCNGDCDGTVTAAGNGGTAPYSYTWSTLGAGQAHSNVCAGTYTVTVSDNNGCTSTSSVTVAEPTALTATASESAKDGGSCNGSAVANASGGTPAYTYMWNDANSQTSATATGLCTGIYEFCVTDGNGCTACDTALVNLATGIRGIEDEGYVRVYPNPASDLFRIEWRSSVQTDLAIRVMNALGQQVYARSANTPNGMVAVDMEGQPEGVYFVVVQGEGLNYTTRMILSEK